MKKVSHFFPIIILFIAFSLETAWGQLFNTLYTHREIEFFEKEEELEGYDDDNFRLIPNTDIYVNFNTGIGLIAEKDNFKQIQSLINTIKDITNQSLESSNQFQYFRDNNVKPYHVGINLDVFLFNYFGLGFTYSRNHYFTHLSSISTPNTSANTNYYNETIEYVVNTAGNNFQFSAMGRYPLGDRLDYNIYLIGGLGYSLSTLSMSLQFTDKINQVSQSQEYSSTSHAFHAFTEMMFKVKHFNFGFGLLLQTIAFTEFTLPDNPEFTPQKYEAVTLGPTLYFKIGFNL